MKIPGTIQVDLDGYWAIMEHFGCTADAEEDPIFKRSIDRFLDLFDNYRIRATFFVVGKDLTISWKIKLVEKIIKKGHEIANHTMNHKRSFSSLPTHEQTEEILSGENIIRKLFGIKTCGFRSPGFDAGPELFEILGENKYLYDSSSLPLLLPSFFRQLQRYLSVNHKTNPTYLGNINYKCLSLRPHRPKKNDGTRYDLLEIPVTTIPCIHIPFHASYIIALKSKGFGSIILKTGFALVQRVNLPLNYLFHLADLADPIHDQKIKGHFGITLRADEKLMIVESIIKEILKKFEIRPTYHFAN